MTGKMFEHEDDLPPERYYAIRDHKGNLLTHEQAMAMQQRQQEEQRRRRRVVAQSIANLQVARDSGDLSDGEYEEQRASLESIHQSLAPDVPGRRGIIGVVQARTENLLQQEPRR